ncbi:MAG: PIN domain-containing protein [Balneolaceae bacterium]
MKGADTNLIVRFLVRDVEEQALKIKRLLDQGEFLFINVVVLSELYWVLVHVYEYSKNDFVIAIDALLDLKNIQFFDREIVRKSLADYIHSNIEFTDCLIHQLNKMEGLVTLTFDKKATRLDNMELVT